MCVNQPTSLLYMILLTNQPTLLLYMILLTNQPTLLSSADDVLTFVLLSWVQWVGQAGGGVARSWHRPWWANCTPARHVASCSSQRFLNISRGQVVASCSSQRFLNRSRGQVVASCSSQRFLNRSRGQVAEETVEFNRFFQIERGKTASAARN